MLTLASDDCVVFVSNEGKVGVNTPSLERIEWVDIPTPIIQVVYTDMVYALDYFGYVWKVGIIRKDNYYYCCFEIMNDHNQLIFLRCLKMMFFEGLNEFPCLHEIIVLTIL